MKNILIQIVGLFILLIQIGCTQIGNAFGNINFYSDEEERSIGSQYAYQIEQGIDLYNDKTIQQYINDLGLRLVKYSKRSNIPYRFKVVNDPSVNAFAIPTVPTSPIRARSRCRVFKLSFFSSPFAISTAPLVPIRMFLRSRTSSSSR